MYLLSPVMSKRLAVQRVDIALSLVKDKSCDPAARACVPWVFSIDEWYGMKGAHPIEKALGMPQWVLG